MPADQYPTDELREPLTRQELDALLWAVRQMPLDTLSADPERSRSLSAAANKVEARLRDIQDGQPDLGGVAKRLENFLRRHPDAHLGIGMSKRGGDFVVMSVFGEEAPGSPMAGGAIHGVGSSVAESLGQALAEARC